MEARWMVGVVAALSMSAFSGAAKAPLPPRPDIVIIVADDLDYNDVGAYNPAMKGLTPSLDTLAEEGIRFEQFYANASICSPSRAALMTGLSPQRFGVRRVFRECTEKGIFNEGYDVDHHATPLKWPTLAQRLASLDDRYRRVHIGKWHLGVERHLPPPNHDYHPLQLGYTEFYGYFHESLLRTTSPDAHCACKGAMCDECQGGYEQPLYLWDDWNWWVVPPEPELDEALTARALSVIASLQARPASGSPTDPLFMTLWYMAPHTPLPGDPGEPKRPRYEQLVHGLDGEIGQVLEAITQKGRDTLILFMSDNGGEAGCDGPDDCIHGRNQPPTTFHLRGERGELDWGGKGTFYEGGIRVPAIISWRGHLKNSLKVLTDPVAAFDVVPTIMELLHAPITDRSVDGVSFARALRAGSAVDNRFLHWENHEEGGENAGDDAFSYAVLRWVPGQPAEYKLIATYPGELEDAQLYDIANDPDESDNLLRPPTTPTYLNEASDLKAEYLKWRKDTSAVPHHVVKEVNASPTPSGTGWIFAHDNSLVVVGNKPLLNPHDGAMSVRMSVHATGLPQSQGSVIVQKGESWRLAWSATRQLEVRLSVASAPACTTTAVYLGQGDKKTIALTFNHIGEQCGRAEKGVVKVYVDGVLRCYGTYDEPVAWNPSVNVQVGNNEASATTRQPFRGTVEDLEFFNVNLTPGEAK